MSENEWSKLVSVTEVSQSTKERVLNPSLISLVKKYCNPGAQVFDYGCGRGEFANTLNIMGLSVMAYDRSDEMVDKAKRRFPKTPLLSFDEFKEQLPLLKNRFDLVTSNLVLCILEKQDQTEMLINIKALLKTKGKAIVSFCHPKYDFLPESLMTINTIPINASYDSEFRYEKTIKENGACFHDYHRPMVYYENLFRDSGFSIMDVLESEVVDADYPPDFILFGLAVG